MTIEHFNLTHILVIIGMPLLIFLSIYFSLAKHDEKIKRKVLLLLCGFNAVLYVAYMIAHVVDPNFHFEILNNLPLHFCNINLVLIPLAILTRNKTLMAYQVYFGFPLATVALIVVYPLFLSTSILEFKTFTYFFYHSVLVVLPILLVKFRIFTPSFKIIWQPTVLLLTLTLIAHIINVTFRATGLSSEANYFFTHGLDGDFFTEFFWSIVPFNFFFLLPALLLFAPYIFVITFIFRNRDQK